MSNLKKMLVLAKNFYPNKVNVGLDCKDDFIVSIEYLSGGDGPDDCMERSWFGVGNTLEDACADYIRKAPALIKYRPPKEVAKPRNVVPIIIN